MDCKDCENYKPKPEAKSEQVILDIELENNPMTTLDEHIGQHIRQVYHLTESAIKQAVCNHCAHEYTPKPTKPAVEWRERDLAWCNLCGWGLVKIIGLETDGTMAVTILRPGKNTNVLASDLSIPTPSQLLVEYNGHKCLTWEDEDGVIIVRYGNMQWQVHSYHPGKEYDDRFLIPAVCRNACVSHDQMERQGIKLEYPRGE